MNNKHKAVWAVGVLLVVFVALLIWYLATHPAPTAFAPGDVATTTPPFIDVPARITDNGQYYEIDAAYPTITPLRESAGVEADARAVAAMKGFEENTIVAFKENAGFMDLTPEEIELFGLNDGRKYAMGIEYDFSAGPATISYVYNIYQDTLGAHPNTYYRTFTFDRRTGEDLHMGDLFVPGAPYLERLSERTRRDLPVIMGRMADIPSENIDRDYIDSGTLPIADAFGNFAINNGTLNVIFPPYQVGPYVYGTITVPIPLADLADILRPEYRQ